MGGRINAEGLIGKNFACGIFVSFQGKSSASDEEAEAMTEIKISARKNICALDSKVHASGFAATADNYLPFIKFPADIKPLLMLIVVYRKVERLHLVNRVHISLSLGRRGMVFVSWLFPLALAVAATPSFANDYLKIPKNLILLSPGSDNNTIEKPPAEMSPAESAANLAPSAGMAPAIPDPDPLTIKPLIPTTQHEQPAALPADTETAAAPATASTSSAPISADEIIKEDLPAALTPIPAKSAESEPPVAMPSVIPPSHAESTEPAPTLSQESKDILAKIPGGIDSKKPASDIKMDIERAKDTKYVSAEKAPPATTSDPANNPMGISVQSKSSPLNFDYELEKAYNAIVAGHTEVAIEIYERILSNDANNKDAIFGLASSYHRAGQIDRARPLYAKLLSLDPNNRDALNNFLLLLADEAPQEALDHLMILEEKNPGYSTIPAQMAVIYQKMGLLDKASDKMFKAAALAPENLTYRYNLAILLDKQEKYEEAVKLYKQLLEASSRGEVIPGNPRKIQERLTFISSNRP